MNLALQAVYKGTVKGKMEFRKGSELERKRGTMVAKAKTEERIDGRRAAARMAEMGKKKVARKEAEPVGRVAGHTAAWCRKGGIKNVYAIDEETNDRGERRTR